MARECIENDYGMCSNETGDCSRKPLSRLDRDQILNIADAGKKHNAFVRESGKLHRGPTA